MESVQEARARRALVAEGVVGRDRELDLILATVAAGRDLILEGPPGTSKSTILRRITATWGIAFHLVEGNAELTPSKLIGHHNPARVLREDYHPDNFVPGPLVAAMQTGGFLYIEEFNRAPEDTLNTLLGAMAEREITIPRVGRITARPTFRLIASMNPYDNIGTTRIPASVADRMCRLALDYQTPHDEQQITRLRTTNVHPSDTVTAIDQLITDAVTITRATRSHPDLRSGASVRGAIDTVLIATHLAALRDNPATSNGAIPGTHPHLLDAALLALTGRIDPYETTTHTPEHLITQLYEDLFVLGPRRATGGRHIDVEPSIGLRRREGSPASGLRPLQRKPMKLRAAPTLFTGSGGAPMQGAGGGRRPPPDGLAARPGQVLTQPTAEDGVLAPLEDLLEDVELETEVRAMAERIARQLSLRGRRRTQTRRRGRGALTTMPYRYGSDDIDLDATLEVLAEHPIPEDTDIMVRERVHSPRAVALIGDVSGSMRGEKVRIATATIAALSADLVHDELAVVAFWSDAALIKSLRQPRSRDEVLRDLLRIPARGLTNIAFGLSVGADQLSRSRVPRRVGLLLSDVVHNAGPDPRHVAARYDTLHVLLEVDGEHDADLAADIARLGRGQVVPVRSHTEVPEVLNRLLSR